MKYLTFLIFISLISTSSFADEIMKCKINNKQSVFFKLEENILSSDKVYEKLKTKWKQQCPCASVVNKSIACYHKLNKTNCKSGYVDPFDAEPDFEAIDFNAHLIDFETKSLIVKFKGTGEEVNFKCNLVK
ncbi:hypothetical protein OAT44_08945 [Alphaproteobacteria bacterium]|nr:hypothetical protein [Alphaproteobacteria bacterium]